MSPTPHWERPALLVGLIALVFAFGCNNKDGSSNPTDPGTGGDSIDEADVASSAVGAMHFVNEFVSEIQDLAAGDFSDVTVDVFANASQALRERERVEIPAGLLANRTAYEMVWTESAQAWVVDATESETTADGSASASVYFAVQFISTGGAPQTLPDESTARMTVDVILGIDLESRSDGQVFDLGLDYDMSMAVTNVATGPYGVEGTGSMGLTMLLAGAGVEDMSASMNMDWLLDALVPIDGGCPSGNISMTVDTSETNPFTFAGTWTGTPNAPWTLKEGDVVVASGTEVISCTVPVL